ncbi:glycosyltransferase family 2 protein [Niveispirillum sp. BGYR6]|uniref:glycosyltransferase family 2 protein n=1 Tax=Niveispirillum sp. BGYR6 TaxID=2971249 RepID=UPI0022B9BCC5|nr:glycosyltransferase family 2 protein [Niveispirillum sp. BGYR6]MDG5497375.1 glycosyltransferase family 2 protein [Niveispirillum sp. BGYR6]
MSSSECQGQIERYAAGELIGWIHYPAIPDQPILLLALVNDKPRSACLANLYRGDLETAGIGQGRHGFRLSMALKPGDEVRLISPLHGTLLLPPFICPTANELAELPDMNNRAESYYGCVDVATGTTIRGWCWKPDNPDVHLRIWAVVDGEKVVEGVADEERGDLVDAGIGRGDHAFTLEMPYWMLDGRERKVDIMAEGVGLLYNGPLPFHSTTQSPRHLLAALVDALPAEKRTAHESTHRLLSAFLDETSVIHPRSIGFGSYADWQQAVSADMPPRGTGTLLWSQGSATREDLAFRHQQPDGDILVLIDAGVQLHPDALERALARFQALDTDILYADAEMQNEYGARLPWFRPDWSYDLFLSQDYTCGLTLIRAGLFDGSPLPTNLPEMKMVAVERARPDHILHLPEVVATLDRVPPNGPLWQESITRHLHRRGFAGATVTPHPRWPDLREITWPAPAVRPLVSLIIPTRDRLDLLRPCVDSILSQTQYRPFEIIIIDNQSRDPETLDYLAQGCAQGQFHVLHYDAPFNYADMNNRAARWAKGSVLGFINNDVELISPAWLDEAVSLLTRPEVGAVGARLRFANGMIQHGGVVAGTGGLAENAFQQYHADDWGYFGRTQATGNYSAVTAACMFCRKQDFMEIGGFDAQNLPVAFNDVDLCLRWREKGLLMVWTPRIELYHYESVSRGRDMAPDRQARAMKEEEYMRNRWHRRAVVDPYYNPNLNLDGRPFRGLAVPPRHRWGGALHRPAFPTWPIAPREEGTLT